MLIPISLLFIEIGGYLTERQQQAKLQRRICLLQVRLILTRQQAPAEAFMPPYRPKRQPRLVGYRELTGNH